jgi:hypothetical protein
VDSNSDFLERRRSSLAKDTNPSKTSHSPREFFKKNKKGKKEKKGK